MQLVKRILVGLVALGLLLAALAWAFQRELGTLVLKRIANTQVGRNIVPDLPDGLHLALCGTGSPFPDPSRAGPCSVVIAGDRVFIIDAGEGAARPSRKADTEDGADIGLVHAGQHIFMQAACRLHRLAVEQAVFQGLDVPG